MKTYCSFIILFFLMIMSPSLVFSLDPALIPAKEGMLVYDDSLQKISLNTAHAQTAGYKEIDVRHVKKNGRLTTETFYRMTKGTLISTGGDLDFYIEGDGFFTISMPSGQEAYTRDGRFDLDESSQLVTHAHGFSVLGEAGPIYLPSGKIDISSGGTILQDDFAIDVLNIVDIKEVKKLRSYEGTLFYFKDPEPIHLERPNYFAIKRGGYESSNVNLTQQLVRMPMVRNVYDANTKVIKAILRNLSSGIQMGSVQ